MIQDSANVQPPYVGPQFPIWPPTECVVQVSAAAVAGQSPPTYPANLCQFDSTTLTFRPREQVYLTEANGATLNVGSRYLAVLMSAFQNLPLLVCACCNPPISGSVGSSASGGGH